MGWFLDLWISPTLHVLQKGGYTFRQCTHEGPEVISLFEFPNADFDDILEVLLHITQKLPTNCTLTGEQTIKGILVFGGWPGKSTKGLWA